ncbi:MAG: radical SAM protein [Planctomycetes bacterium DG_20]|nr:MAG: radical SAM protein [Planctomycetes bacterium DG_20]
MHEAMYYEKRQGGSVQCHLCPHHCLIKPDERGRCRARENQGGTLFSLNYGRATSVAMDPIEKKPLYHFYPGTDILSLGTFGCNFQCPYCQNWQISQGTPMSQEITSDQAVALARQRRSIGIAYTYNEPIIWYEFVLHTARKAAAQGLKNVLVTNGFIEQEPLRELLPVIDALNVDVKSGSPAFYRELCKGRLEPVLAAVETAAQEAHVEVTTLVIPGQNDSDEDLEAVARWVSEHVGRHVPAHLSAYTPRYRFTAPPTPLQTLQRAYDLFARHLDYVYLGNVMARDGSDTRCPGCGAVLIRRSGYHVEMVGLDGARCRACGRPCPVVLEGTRRVEPGG